MSLQVTRVNTPTNLYPYKCPYAMMPKSITVHETGNFATAMAEISYMLSNTHQVSYHFAVDDERAVQGLPLNRNGWHSGDGQGPGNRQSIGFEICFNWRNGQLTNNDKVYNAKYLKARANAIEIIAQTCVSQKIVPKQGVTLFRHYDRSKKNCPQRIIADGNWTPFCNAVVKRYDELRKGGTTVAKENNRTRHSIYTGNFTPGSAAYKRVKSYMDAKKWNYKEEEQKDGRVRFRTGRFNQNSSTKFAFEKWLGENNYSYTVNLMP